MRDLTPGELASLREFLITETTALVNLKAAETLLEDEDLKTLCQTGIQSAEGRLKTLQQFLQENDIMSIGEVQ